MIQVSLALLTLALGMPPDTGAPASGAPAAGAPGSGASASGAPGKMTSHQMAARPLPDETLERGTVSVLLRGGIVEGVDVFLVPAAALGEDGQPSEEEILSGGKTNAEGRLFLKATLHAGREVRVLVKPETGPQWSVPFHVPLVGGVRLLFMASGKGTPHGMGTPPGPPDPHAGHGHHPHGDPDPHRTMRPTGPTTRDPSGLQLWLSFRVIAIEGGDLYMGITYTLLNRGEATFDPGDHGLLLPVPQGHAGVSLPHSGEELKAEPQGIVVKRLVPLGRHGLQFTANVKLKADSRTLPLRLRSLVPIIGYSASISNYATVYLAGKDFETPEPTMASQQHGGLLILFRSKREGFPTSTISFQVTGVPVRSRARSLPFALGALLFLLGGIVLSVAYTGGPAPKASSTPEGKAGPEDPVQTLVNLERDRLLGLLDAKAFQAERERVLGTVPQDARKVAVNASAMAPTKDSASAP